MSYILDALRKSDQQRQRGSTPTLLTVQATVTDPKRPKVLLNGVLAAVLICAGIAVGWLRPWQTKQAAPAAEPIVSTAPAPSTRLAAPTPPFGSPELSGQAERDLPTDQSNSAAQAAPRSAGTATPQDTPAHAHDEPPTPSSQPDTGMQVPDNTAPAGTAAEAEKRVVTLNELPPSVQREIPSLSISFHAYSNNPKERRVMINGSMVKQGEPLAPGLSLAQITPDGVILDYKGYRFQQGVR
jgi:general secretion pathway protein B